MSTDHVAWSSHHNIFTSQYPLNISHTSSDILAALYIQFVSVKLFNLVSVGIEVRAITEEDWSIHARTTPRINGIK